MSFIIPEVIGRTVWRHFGEDYGFFPLFQPLLGLIWLLWPLTMAAYGIRGRRSASSAPTALLVRLPLQWQPPCCCRLPTSCCEPPSRAPSAAWKSCLAHALGRGLEQHSLAVLVTFLSLLLRLPLAWLTVRTDLPGRQVWSPLLALPLVIPTYVGAFALMSMLGPRGIVQGWLEPLGIERLPAIYGLPGAVWALTIFFYPYLLLASAPACSTWTRPRRRPPRPGSWPMAHLLAGDAAQSAPGHGFGGLLLALYVLSDFGAVSLVAVQQLHPGHLSPVSGSLDRSQAALLSLVLVALTMCLLIAARWVQGRQRYHRAGVGAARRQQQVPLGHWRRPAFLFCSTVADAALLMPMGVFSIGCCVAWQRAKNCCRSGTPQPTASMPRRWPRPPVSWVRCPWPTCRSLSQPLQRWLGRVPPSSAMRCPASSSPSAWSFSGPTTRPILYQTLAMLVFGYTVRFLPQALGTLRTGLLQISPRLEEARAALA